jgi:hypothetical protein
MLRKCIILIILLKGFGIGKCLSQNLISNPSFSEVKTLKDTLKPHYLLPGNLSEVKSWYLPTYIDYKKHHFQTQFNSLYGSTYYMSSRDKDIFIRAKYYTNGEQLLENNLGFIQLGIDGIYPKTTIQQHLIKPLNKGIYCFKFKYKYMKNWSFCGFLPLEICFSKTDLKEYYKQKLTVPINKIQVSLLDSVTNSDENTPWRQQCYVLNLNGDEQYLTIGGLNNPQTISTARYWIDDMELTPLNETAQCDCEIINKDLTQSYHKEFSTNEIVENDTLVMFNAHNGWVNPIMPPEIRKYFLYDLISYMQRNSKVKIKYFEYTPYPEDIINSNASPLLFFQSYKRFFLFYGISMDRIKGEYKLCGDPTSIYCKERTNFIKIGFEFYYE